MLEKTGPGINSNFVDCWLKTETPVTSPGSKSGEHCSRRKVTPSDAATAREHRLPDARHVFDQDVPFAQERGKDQLDRFALPDDDFFDVARDEIRESPNFVHHFRS